jgi:CheY-like chemotaxis protein
MLETETTWDFLSELKRNPDTRALPVVVVTVLSRAEKARALGADEFWLKPLDQDRLVKKLRSLVHSADAPRLLVVRDDNA